VSDEPNGTLSRWSQRKLAARHGAVIDEPPPEKSTTAPPATADENSAAAAENPAAAVASEAETETPKLPPIDELTFESDFTGFLHKNVPEHLRRAALRKLWASDPVFGIIDGLDDYAEDFNVIDTPITLAQTSYKVGKGYLDEVKEAVDRLEPEAARLGPDHVGEVDAKSSADTPPEPTAQDNESPDAQASDEAGVADDARDDSRQFAAASPEPSESAEDAGKRDGVSTPESGQRRGA
jgi:Protein of unknown function (DUF3306)